MITSKRAPGYFVPVDESGNVGISLTGSNVADAQTSWTPGMLYNETTSDKPRGNTQGILLASAARAASVASPQQTNYNARGVQIFLSISAASGTGGLQVQIQGYDPVSLSALILNAAPTNILATGTYAFELYPGVSGAGVNVSQRTSAVLTRSWRVSVIHVDASSYTYSLGYALIL